MCTSVSRPGESRQFTQSPRLRRHVVPQRGQADGSSCSGIEVELPLIEMLNAEYYKLTTARPDELDPAAGAQSPSLMFLRDLEGEVLENIALSLRISWYLQRDFRILVRFGRELRDTREGLFRISKLGYSVALNAAHR